MFSNYNGKQRIKAIAVVGRLLFASAEQALIERMLANERVHRSIKQRADH